MDYKIDIKVKKQTKKNRLSKAKVTLVRLQASFVLLTGSVQS